jgi:uncharacterized protein
MPRPEPVRECCLTRQTRPASELIRFALSPDGRLLPDVDAKAPGRGAWVTLSEAAVAEAVRTKAFARSLRQPVIVPADLAFEARSRLEERLLGALGLARKAGQLVTGAEKTRAAILGGRIAALLTASDAAEDGRNKMIGLLRSRDPGGHVPHLELLTSGQLGLALGGENVIHAALVAGPAAKAAVTRAERLMHYCRDGRKEDLGR